MRIEWRGPAAALAASVALIVALTAAPSPASAVVPGSDAVRINEVESQVEVTQSRIREHDTRIAELEAEPGVGVAHRVTGSS